MRWANARIEWLWIKEPAIYMGSGTFVDGVRRWFQRRNTSASSSSASNNFVNGADTDLSGHPQSSATSVHERGRKEEGGELENQLTVIEDFDFSGLKHIRVPKRSTHFAFGSTTTIGPPKKVKKEVEIF